MNARRALILSLLAAAVGCGGTPARPAGGGPATGLAVVNSDYSTTSLSLLDETGALVRPDCVNSATGATGGPAKIISGDVVLPSQPPGGGVVLIDRGNGVLTSVDPTSCTIVRQIPVPGGAKTNPHDLVMLSDHKAYVTRYDPNLATSDPDLAGNDVIAIDPTSGALLARIALDGYASPAGPTTALARADRALLVNGQVIVSLNEIDQKFASYGEGQLIVIDPDTDAVTDTVVLTGLSNCGDMAYLASQNVLLVTCGGPFGGATAQSGIAVVDLGASPPALARVIPSAAFDGRPLGSVAEAADTGDQTRAFAITNDPNDVDPDALFELDAVAGTTTAVATSGAYTLGTPLALPGLLLVPNATRSMPRIDRFDVTAAPAPAGSFTSDPITNLPPRAIAPY